MKIVFIGSVQLSEIALRCVLEQPAAAVVGVVTRGTPGRHSDFAPLAGRARSRGIPCLEMEGLGQDALADWIRARDPDTVFCIGWSQLLGQAILQITRRGVIGYHPALLPRHRGRHPLIWALALGLHETGSTFFYMDEGADSGDILDQERIAIFP